MLPHSKLILAEIGVRTLLQEDDDELDKFIDRFGPIIYVKQDEPSFIIDPYLIK